MSLLKIIPFLFFFTFASCNANSGTTNSIDILFSGPKIESYQATYVEKFFDQGSKNPSFVVRGTSAFKKPQYTRLEYLSENDDETNNKMLEVSNGTIRWSYNPKLNLVMKEDLLAGKQDFFKAYGTSSSYVTKDRSVCLGKEIYNGVKVLAFQVNMPPKLANVDDDYPIMKKIYIGEEDAIIRAIVSYDKKNKIIHSQEYTVTKANIEFEENFFNFIPPLGAEIETIP